MYSLLRPWLFQLEPERAHLLTLRALETAQHSPLAMRWLRHHYQPTQDVQEGLGVDVFGLHFANPIVLAAGMDKDARALLSWQALGFAGIEVGSITAHAQAGNPKPRLFRLQEHAALINRFGFNNEGAAVVAQRLHAVREAQQLKVPLGINIGKSKVAPLANAPEDYQASIRRLEPFADYLAINVSSPNTAGLRDLQQQDQLRALLQACLSVSHKPLLVKIAPDISLDGLEAMLHVIHSFRVAGIIATNTTTSRQAVAGHPHATQAGGLSGAPLAAASLELLQALRSRTHLPIISVGGTANGEDVYARLKHGASLVQVYTAFVYGGPGFVARCCLELKQAMQRDGISQLAQLAH